MSEKAAVRRLFFCYSDAGELEEKKGDATNNERIDAYIELQKENYHNMENKYKSKWGKRTYPIFASLAHQIN